MIETLPLKWTLEQFLALSVILCRVGPLLFMMPVFGSVGVPVPVKALFSLMVSLVLLPVVQVSAAMLPTSPVGYGIFVATEIAFAGILALFARLVFAAVQLAGQYVSVSMGFGMAATMDPQFGTQESLVGVLWNIIAILIFLAIDGHHIFVSTLVESFNWVRPGTIHISEATVRGMVAGFGHMFVLGIKIMAPASAVLMFSHVAMGVLAKTVPQIPVMIVAMPMNIAIGFVFITLSMSYFLPVMVKNFEMLGRLLPRLAMGMGG